MVPDAECLKIIVEILDKLDIGQYRIYVSCEVVQRSVCRMKCLGQSPKITGCCLCRLRRSRLTLSTDQFRGGQTRQSELDHQALLHSLTDVRLDSVARGA